MFDCNKNSQREREKETIGEDCKVVIRNACCLPSWRVWRADRREQIEDRREFGEFEERIWRMIGEG